ncbi:MAG: hypothetical protein WA652_15485 [Xanthobacteraceae bacterium]
MVGARACGQKSSKSFAEAWQGGAGLGVALVQHFLNRQSGRLTIDSAPGATATFSFHQPTAASPIPP